MNKCTERLYNGLVKENPTFVLMLGMCPTLAVTTSAINGVGMGLSTTVVLIMSNMLISMLRKIIPDSVRMPAFIVIVASFVTIVQFLMEGFVPSPPNNCFTTMMANTAPSTPIHHGSVGGRFNASRSPVTTALKSLIVIGLCINFS